MEKICTSSLTNRAAMRFARRILRDIESGMTLDQALSSRDVPSSLTGDLRAIMDAITAGWFAIPQGPDLTYSRQQHGRLSSLSSQAPWLVELLDEARTFEAVRSMRGPAGGKAFGVRSLPNFLADAQGAGTRLARLPREHTANEITLDLWVQILVDTQSVAIDIRRHMECLGPSWMWNPSHQLSEQIERLKSFNCLHLLVPYLSTTRNRSVDTFELKLLKDVQYRGLETCEYLRRLDVEHQRRIDEEHLGWLERFALIRRLASILEGVTSYHHGTLTRRLKQESKGSFRLQRSEMGEGGLVVEVQSQYWVGQAANLETGFQLVNYCLALADEIEQCAPVFTDYLSACARAHERIKNLSEPTTNAPFHHDDGYGTDAA